MNGGSNATRPLFASEMLGTLAFHDGHEPPWIGRVPPAWRPQQAEENLEIYLGGDSSAPDAACLRRAEQAVRHLKITAPACVQLLLQRWRADYPSCREPDFTLMWLVFEAGDGPPDWEAVFACDDPTETYRLWIVTARGDDWSVRFDFW